jgi:hypothetical protein
MSGAENVRARITGNGGAKATEARALAQTNDAVLDNHAKRGSARDFKGYEFHGASPLCD